MKTSKVTMQQSVAKGHLTKQNHTPKNHQNMAEMIYADLVSQGYEPRDIISVSTIVLGLLNSEILRDEEPVN